MFCFWDTFTLKLSHFLVWQNAVCSTSKQVFKSFILGTSTCTLGVTCRPRTVGEKFLWGCSVTRPALRLRDPKPWRSAEANVTRLIWLSAANPAHHLHNDAKGLQEVATNCPLICSPKSPGYAACVSSSQAYWRPLDVSQRISLDYWSPSWGGKICGLVLTIPFPCTQVQTGCLVHFAKLNADKCTLTE